MDHFSSHFNSQVARFNSKYFSPGCSAVDALAQDWGSDNNWLCPPMYLMVASVKHLCCHMGVGTLVIPEWPSAAFWPFLHSSPSQFASFVKEFVVLRRLPDLLIGGPGQRATYHRGLPCLWVVLRSICWRYVLFFVDLRQAGFYG